MDTASDVPPAASDGGAIATPASDVSTALMTSLSMAANAAGSAATSAAAFTAKHDHPAAASHTALSAPPTKKRKFAHTNEAQRRCMLEWLEMPGNFQLLASRSGSAVVDGKKIKKTDGFRALMRFVNLHTGANWSMDITKSRFESFLTSYRKVKRQAQQTTFTLTENDRARGITSITQKLNTLCAFFDRIDALHDSAQQADPFVDQPVGQANDSVEDSTVEPAPAIDTTGGAVLNGVEVALEGENDECYKPQDSIESSPKEESGEEQPQPTDAPVVEEMLSATATMEGVADPPLSPSPNVGISDEIALQQLAMERERLDLLQEQLAVQKREIELKARALQQQEDDKRRAARADLAAKLAQSGKSIAEIKELLDVVM